MRAPNRPRRPWNGVVLQAPNVNTAGLEFPHPATHLPDRRRMSARETVGRYTDCINYSYPGPEHTFLYYYRQSSGITFCQQSYFKNSERPKIRQVPL